MLRIQKYRLSISIDRCFATMPAVSNIFTVSVENEITYVWAAVDTSRWSQVYEFHLIYDGDEIPPGARYIGPAFCYGEMGHLFYAGQRCSVQKC